MRVKRDGDNIEIFVEPEERDSIRISNKKLKELINDHKEQIIGSIIEFNLVSIDYNLKQDIIQSIGASLQALIGAETANFFSIS